VDRDFGTNVGSGHKRLEREEELPFSSVFAQSISFSLSISIWILGWDKKVACTYSIEGDVMVCMGNIVRHICISGFFISILYFFVRFLQDFLSREKVP